MVSKIKNTLIFVVIVALLVLAYIFFIKPSPEEENLISSSFDGNIASPNNSLTLEQNSVIARDFLSVLLSVRGLNLDDSIFSNEAFTALNDSSIILTPPSPEEKGRSNPFAPIGHESSGIFPTQ